MSTHPSESDHRAPWPDDDPAWDRLLHVHGQSFHHGSAYIVGNRLGLEALRRALNDALEQPGDAVAKTDEFTTDGEGYEVQIQVVDRHPDEMPNWALPYTDSFCADKREDIVWPWQRMRAPR